MQDEAAMQFEKFCDLEAVRSDLKRELLGYLRRLVFKAVICMERAHERFKGKIRPRGAKL